MTAAAPTNAIIATKNGRRVVEEDATRGGVAELELADVGLSHDLKVW